MVAPVQITQSSVALKVPVAAELLEGALAVNVIDGALYSMRHDNSIIRVEGDTGNGTIASGASIALGAVMGGVVDVTGVTTVAAVVLREGQSRTVRFTGALTLTNSASLVLPGGANIVTVAGDYATFRGYASGVTRCTNYSFAAASTTTGTNTGDETTATIKTKLGITTLSGSNTGDQTLPTLASLGGQPAGTYATGTGSASGTNTGDQTLPTLLSLGAAALAGNAAQAFSTAALTASGLVDISGSGAGQISFPATQNPSAGANTLDDYEEGAWTPSVGGSATYTAQLGKYTKIGRLVTLRASLQINVLGTGSTTTITGLPYPSAGDILGGFAVGYFANLATSVIHLAGYVGATSILFVSASAALTTVNNAVAILGNGTRVDFTLSYEV